MAALTIMPALPQEDPKQLEARIQEWDSDMQPQNAAERVLVRQGAWLSLAIERGERIEMAYMARRVKTAGLMRTQKVSARRRKQVRELGRRLLYVAGPEEVKVDKQLLWADNPEQIVNQLEASAEGCRWLLERWAEYRNLLARETKWDEAVLLRFIRLQGENVVESVYDPVLNSIFLAWDVLVQKFAKVEWESFRIDRPTTDPGYNHRLQWREIADRPSDPAAAWAVLHAIVDQHVGQLEWLLAENEAKEAAEDPDWADRAALDTSPASQGPERYQSAKRRDLLRTLNTLCRMRKSEFGMGNGKSGVAEEECRMADGNCHMANDECQMAKEECRMAEEECQMANDPEQSSGPMTERSSGPVVGHDSDRVMDDLQDDKIGILSHEGAHAAGQPGQGDGLEQNLDCGVNTPEKAPYEANSKSTQTILSHRVESEKPAPERRERSHL